MYLGETLVLVTYLHIGETLVLVTCLHLGETLVHMTCLHLGETLVVVTCLMHLCACAKYLELMGRHHHSPVAAQAHRTVRNILEKHGSQQLN